MHNADLDQVVEQLDMIEDTIKLYEAFGSDTGRLEEKWRELDGRLLPVAECVEILDSLRPAI